MKYQYGLLALGWLLLTGSAAACGCGGAELAGEAYRWSADVRLEWLWHGWAMTAAVFAFYLLLSLAKFSSRRFIAYCALAAMLNVALSLSVFDSGADVVWEVYRTEHALLLHMLLCGLPIVHALYQWWHYLRAATERPVNDTQA
ncbi:hypothetical protein LVJ82_07010 [Vitreoscilla massiliensis]|uniref:Lipoprotein n=1 Tax=Vitreoscilla massiliensis TaxID=1689272 RepID=A0ABY4E5S0_9NEIS|nr:hypothetical protein [Vitreoscilla massiliensis]UOO90710.1 hypothetical protein LVJ82_07010 [Vitreoscilla massiliensis]